MKEAMRRVLPGLRGNYGIIFVLKPSAEEPVFAELVADIASAMEKARIIERGGK
jgi:RNase P protein component